MTPERIAELRGFAAGFWESGFSKSQAVASECLDDIERLRAALLGVSKKSQHDMPCWCVTCDGIYCVDQDRPESDGLMKKKTSGAAWMRQTGRLPVSLGLLPHEAKKIRSAAAADGRHVTQFFIHHGLMAAEKILSKS